jgi:hypothetical protein
LAAIKAANEYFEELAAEYVFPANSTRSGVRALANRFDRTKKSDTNIDPITAYSDITNPKVTFKYFWKNVLGIRQQLHTLSLLIRDELEKWGTAHSTLPTMTIPELLYVKISEDSYEATIVKLDSLNDAIKNVIPKTIADDIDSKATVKVKALYEQLIVDKRDQLALDEWDTDSLDTDSD